MEYTHYWYRRPIIDKKIYEAIVIDFKKVLPAIDAAGVQIADRLGKEEPEITAEMVCFNGAVKCGHMKDEEVVIPWPSKDAGGVGNQFIVDGKAGNWFAGVKLQTRICNGDCSYETFHFPRDLKTKEDDIKDEKSGLYFGCCKTAFRPYDIAVTVFLLIAKKHIGDSLKVKTDGEDAHWFDAKFLCQNTLGYGLDYSVDQKGEFK